MKLDTIIPGKNTISTFLAVSTAVGGVVWLSRSVLPLTLAQGAIFGAISTFAARIGQLACQKIDKSLSSPILLRGTQFLLTFGLPLAIFSRMKPLTLREGVHLTLIVVLARKFFICFNFGIKPFLGEFSS